MITFWTSAKRAQELGCTHRGLFLGIIPGFVEPHQAIWVARSDLLVPFEWLLTQVWFLICEANGEDPTFFWEISGPIEEGRH